MLIGKPLNNYAYNHNPYLCHKLNKMPKLQGITKLFLKVGIGIEVEAAGLVLWICVYFKYETDRLSIL